MRRMSMRSLKLCTLQGHWPLEDRFGIWRQGDAGLLRLFETGTAKDTKTIGLVCGYEGGDGACRQGLALEEEIEGGVTRSCGVPRLVLRRLQRRYALHGG